MIVNFKGVSPLAEEGPEDFFEKIFRAHFRGLHTYACTLIKDPVMAEEAVQNVFVRLWEKKEALSIRESITGYLYRAVHNESLNHLKHRKVRLAHQSYLLRRHNPHDREKASEKVTVSELQQQLEKAVLELPEQCRLIFRLSRSEELKYKEIADKLGLSVKTVENQMGKALKLLRQKLADFLPLMVMLLITFFKER
jgi:RNA polymerase sigma-70 factor (ECF subfamily)